MAVAVPDTAVVVQVETAVYSPAELDAARTEVLAAAAVAAGGAVVAVIASAITFPVAIEAIAAGSAARCSMPVLQAAGVCTRAMACGRVP